jgi:hypothetical protein
MQAGEFGKVRDSAAKARAISDRFRT